MATPNYSYEKRQRELAKKRKAEEKRQKKQQRGQDGAPVPDDGSSEPSSDGEAAPSVSPPSTQQG